MSVIKKNLVPYLTNLGFQGAKLQLAIDDVAAYEYSKADFTQLELELGDPTVVLGDDFIYQIKNKGAVVVNHTRKLVTLLNNKSIYKDIKDVKLLHRTLRLPESVYKKFLAARELKGDAKIPVLNEIWEVFNKLKFDSKLKTPNYVIEENLGLASTTRGSWTPSLRRLKINEGTFYAPVDIIAETVLHEMCHQAVTEIDLITEDDGEGGHGQPWVNWMKRVGLPPERYSKEDKVLFLDEEQTRQLDDKHKQQIPVGYSKLNRSNLKLPKFIYYTVENTETGRSFIVPALALFTNEFDRLRVLISAKINAPSGYSVDNSTLLLEKPGESFEEGKKEFFIASKLYGYPYVQAKKYMVKAVQVAAYEDGHIDDATYWVDWIENEL